MPLDVSGEVGGGLVAARAVLFERFEHNPVEVAAKLLDEFFRRRTAVRSADFIRRARVISSLVAGARISPVRQVHGQPGAGAGWLRLADCLAHRVNAGLEPT